MSLSTQPMLLLASLLTFTACGEANPRDLPPLDAEVESAMPLLPRGQHVSMIIGFEHLPFSVAAAVDEHWVQALDAGMKVGRMQIDWADLDDGTSFKEGPLRVGLRNLKRDGLRSFVGIYAIDSEGLVLPAHLSDPNTPSGLVDGIEMDDPRVTNRYKELIDWAVPILLDEGCYVLSIANEPEVYMSETPAGPGPALSFYKIALDHLRAKTTEIAGTVTLTSAPIFEKYPFHDEVIASLDVAAYNYYCLELTDRFEFRGPSSSIIPRDFQVLLEESQGKELIFQEFGCSAGFSDRESVIGVDENKQAEFFRVGFQEMTKQPRIRAAYVFQLVDWSGELFSIYDEVLAEEGLTQVFIDSFREWLTTCGFIEYETGRTRPAWNVFLEAIR